MEFSLGCGAYRTVVVKYYGAAAAGALIKGKDVFVVHDGKEVRSKSRKRKIERRYNPRQADYV